MRFGTSDAPTVAMIRSVNVGVTSAIDNGVSAPGAGRYPGSVRRLRACGIFLLQRGQIPRSDIVVTTRLGHDRDVHVMAMGVDAVIPPPNPGLNDAADDLRIRDQVENRVSRDATSASASLRASTPCTGSCVMSIARTTPFASGLCSDFVVLMALVADC